MTTLEKIVKEAKTIKKNFPNKFAKWTDYIKEASKKFRSKTAPDKKKSNLGAVKKVTKKQVKKKLTSKKASDQIRAEVKSKKFIMPHGYEVRKSKLAGIKKKEFNLNLLIGKEVFKSVGAKDVYTITEIKQITPNNIKMKLEKNNFSTEESYTLQNLIDLSKGKIVRNLKLLKQISGSKITPAEHYLSYAPSKPNEKAIYKGIERVKNDILRLQAMQKDHMFKKHKASLSGAINTKNKEIKELLKKLK
jgi:hypothetical protein